MNATNYRVRRATVDDMGQLGPLLKATLLPSNELERRFTEFQVVEDGKGQLIGALGLQVVHKHGKVHSESYSDFGMSDRLRPLLWERIQKVASNHGLIRLWTQETAPFWKHEGFAPAVEENKALLPEPMGNKGADWLTLKLRDDPETVLSLDKEFAVFMEAEKARTEEMYSQAKFLKGIAYFLAIGLLLFVLGGAFMLFRKRSKTQADGWRR
jgi:N-acetylglutamate synthase-like GNAT family acetyltransferase